MTVTETESETADAPGDGADVGVTAVDPAEAGPVVSPSEPTGLAAVVGSGDHKVIGRLYIGFSLVFVLVSGVAGQLVAVDKIDGELGNTVLAQDSWFQVFTLHSVSGVFLFLVPLLLGVAMCVVPLQVGASTLAFPRAAATSFWAWLMGGGLLIAAYAINGGPDGGSAEGVDLWVAAFVVVLAALLLGAVSVVTTVLALRAPGMGLARIPMFAWSMVVAGSLWLLSLPVLIAVLVLMYVDHRYGRVAFGEEGRIMYERIIWALRQPQIYAFAVPALGFVADVIPTTVDVRQRQRPVVMGAIAAFGVLGFGAFIQSTVNPDSLRQPVYDAMAVLAVGPGLALLGLWATTLRSGRLRLASPLLFAIASVLMLLVATLVGALGPIDSFDLNGPLFAGAQVHYTVLAAAIAGFGALWYWATKIIGRPLAEGLGRLAAVALLLGTVVLALPDVLSTAFGSDQEQQVGIEGLNVVSAVGGTLTIVAILLCVLGLLGGLRRSAGNADEDPWGRGQTLEWATSSPPASADFDGLLEVTSAEPLVDRREAVVVSAGEGAESR
ncbi:MAG: cbb3-type cytochrome c oxidase subunit I [Acidimicrobiales bacterium]